MLNWKLEYTNLLNKGHIKPSKSPWRHTTLCHIMVDRDQHTTNMLTFVPVPGYNVTFINSLSNFHLTCTIIGIIVAIWTKYKIFLLLVVATHMTRQSYMYIWSNFVPRQFAWTNMRPIHKGNLIADSNVHKFHAINRESQPLVTYEPIEFWGDNRWKFKTSRNSPIVLEKLRDLTSS